MPRRAFTLVELLVVISIIGLMSTIAVVSFSGSITKARDTKRVADITQFQKALELYYAVNGQYPSSGGATAPNGIWTTSNDSSWATLQGFLNQYMATLPKDPKQSASGWPADPNTYAYSYFTFNYGCDDHQWYMIVYQLEVADGRPDPGFRECSGNFFQYGGNGSSTKIKTIGVRAGK